MQLQQIAGLIKQNGGNLYLVGGAIRNKIIGIENHDEDYCVTGITAEQFKNLFPEAKIIGKSFEVFELHGKQFAIARTESKQGTGHKEFKINTSPQITIQQDLARRDITINSIAQEVLTGEIIDPFNRNSRYKKQKNKSNNRAFQRRPTKSL